MQCKGYAMYNMQTIAQNRSFRRERKKKSHRTNGEMFSVAVAFMFVIIYMHAIIIVHLTISNIQHSLMENE